jgi:pilus assembly protein CpaB
LAAFGALLLLVYLKRYEREMSGGERVEVVTAVRALSRGQSLTQDMLATRWVPVAYVEDRAVKASERTKVLGLPLALDLGPQQTVLWTDLAITSDERDLSTLVQPGKRGMTVKAASANDTVGNSLVRPGDYVDVIVAMADPKTQKEMAASVLLQRVLVLAVGEDTGVTPGWVEPTTKSNAEKLLTLSLSLAEGQLLALALERGRLSVVVRNASDPAVQGDVPDVKETALLNAAERAQWSQKDNAGAAPVSIGGTRP